MKWGAALCVLMVAPCPAEVARAQETADDERARLHFTAGRSYYEEGGYEQALQEFTRAYALSPRAELLVNIANSQERLGQWGAAADSLERFAETLPESDAQLPTLRRRIANLRQRAEQHEREQQAGGAPTVTTSPSPVGAIAAESPRDAAPAATGPNDGLVALYFIGAFAGAGAGGLATFGGLAVAEEARIARGCGATVSCTAEEVGQMDDLALAADISLATLIAAVAAGAIVFIVDPPRSGSSEQATARIVPFGGPNASGVAVVGVF